MSLVLASVAKQPSFVPLDCFVAPLLATMEFAL